MDLPVTAASQIFLLALISPAIFLTHLLARSYGFFKCEGGAQLEISLPRLLSVFTVYLLGLTLLGNLIFSLALLTFTPTPSQSAILTTLTYLPIASAIIFLSLKPNLWNRDKKQTSDLVRSFFRGIATWPLAFPSSLFIHALLTLLLFLLTTFTPKSQRMLDDFQRIFNENRWGIPSISLLFLILIMGPLVEEILFRGFLQNYLKKFLKVKWAILITSLLFAALHFDRSSGLNNIPLIASLLVFSLYLGYLYQREGTLFASFGLHMTFNLISMLQIIYGM